MITTRSREAYDGSWRIVLYAPGEGGKVGGELTRSSFDAEIDDYYVQREKELARLQSDLLEDRISPLAVYMQLSRMTVDDAAARMRLRKSKVKDHLTPKGFDAMPIEVLRRYARLFDISVADFFQFTHLDGDLAADVQRSPSGLAQKVRVRPAAGALSAGEPLK